MAQVDIGKIKIVWKGPWNSGTAYTIDDAVSHSGSSYICIQAGTNQNPSTATAYWQQMAGKGTDADLINISGTVQGDIYYNNGSAIARLAPGTANQVLKTGGASANPSWGTVSSDFVKLATFQQLTSVNEVSIDGYFTSDYDTYIYEMVNLGDSSDNKIKIYMNQSGTKVTANNMVWLIHYADLATSNNSASETVSNSNADNNIRVGWCKSDMNGGSARLTLHNPLSTTLQKQMRVEGYSEGSSGYHYTVQGGAQFSNTGAISGITIGGNTTSNTIKFHRVTVYGLKH